MKLALFLVLFIGFTTFAQENTFKAPEYRGGKEALKSYLYDNYKYPSGETKEGIIKVQFTLSKYGYVYEIVIIEGLSEKLDEEALRVIDYMSSWRSARKNGNRIETTVVLPIRVKYTEKITSSTKETPTVKKYFNEVEEVVEIEMDETPTPVAQVEAASVDIEESDMSYLDEDTNKVFDVAEVEPEYIGGDEAMMQFIAANFAYPDSAKINGEQGTVYVQFTVKSNGAIMDVKTVRGVSQSLDAEAERVISIMPKWKPAMQAGKKINIRYILPIKARLN